MSTAPQLVAPHPLPLRDRGPEQPAYAVGDLPVFAAQALGELAGRSSKLAVGSD